jgi:hypothetical protein
VRGIRHVGLARRFRVRVIERGCRGGPGVCGRKRGWREGARCTIARGVDGRVGAVGQSR